MLRHYSAVEGELVITGREKQILKGNDRKKGSGKGKGRSRFPRGMTERKAKAKEKQIPKGNDSKKGKGGRSR